MIYEVLLLSSLGLAGHFFWAPTAPAIALSMRLVMLLQFLPDMLALTQHNLKGHHDGKNFLLLLPGTPSG